MNKSNTREQSEVSNKVIVNENKHTNRREVEYTRLFKRFETTIPLFYGTKSFGSAGLFSFTMKANLYNL